jgi:PTH1 family peptidyl-tRNA hydrolase
MDIKYFHQNKKDNTDCMNKFLIVDLERRICNTHNIGFKILDYFAKEQLSFETVKLGALAEYKFKGRTFLLLKPNTYMNFWKTVHYWMDKKISLENIFIVMIILLFGTIRIKPRK